MKPKNTKASKHIAMDNFIWCQIYKLTVVLHTLVAANAEQLSEAWILKAMLRHFSSFDD
jgi:hypothetical protein